MGCLGCNPIGLGIQAGDIALLSLIFGATLNHLRKQDLSWSSAIIIEFLVALLGIVTLGLTLWAIFRNIMSIGKSIPFVSDDSDDEAGEKEEARTSKLNWALAGCLVANVGLWIYSLSKGNSTMICTGLGISSTTCSSTWVKIPFYIVFIMSILLQIAFLVIAGLGSIKLTKLFKGGRRRISNIRKHRNKEKEKKKRRKEDKKKKKSHRRHSMGKAERRESIEGDEMRGLGEWSSASSVTSEGSDSDDKDRRVPRSRLNEQRRVEDGRLGLSDEELGQIHRQN